MGRPLAEDNRAICKFEPKNRKLVKRYESRKEVLRDVGRFYSRRFQTKKSKAPSWRSNRDGLVRNLAGKSKTFARYIYRYEDECSIIDGELVIDEDLERFKEFYDESVSMNAVVANAVVADAVVADKVVLDEVVGGIVKVDNETGKNITSFACIDDAVEDLLQEMQAPMNDNNKRATKKRICRVLEGDLDILYGYMYFHS